MNKIINGQIEFELEYLHVEKMSGKKRTINITHRALETIVESLSDYSCLVYEESKNHPENVLLTMQMKEKVKELNSIMLTIAKAINYNKSCKTKDINDVGMDAFSIMARRRRKK